MNHSLGASLQAPFAPFSTANENQGVKAGSKLHGNQTGGRFHLDISPGTVAQIHLARDNCVDTCCLTREGKKR